jgi:5-keto-L-gluconate epimerase
MEKLMKISVSVTDTPGPFSPMLLAGDLCHSLDRAAALGYDAVELFLLDPRSLGIEVIGNEVKARGLEVSAIGPGLACYQNGWSFAHPDADIRRLALDRIFDHVCLAAQFSTCINIGGIRARLAEYPDLAKQQKNWILECVRRCAEYAGSLGVTLGIEPINRYETNYLNTVAEALGFVEMVGHSNVGVLLDTFHMNIEERSIENAIVAARGRIVNVHLPDSNRLAPGWGHLSLDRVLATLVGTGYDRFLSMELLPIPNGEEAAVQALNHTRDLLGNLTVGRFPSPNTCR